MRTQGAHPPRNSGMQQQMLTSSNICPGYSVRLVTAWTAVLSAVPVAMPMRTLRPGLTYEGWTHLASSSGKCGWQEHHQDVKRSSAQLNIE